MTLLLYRYFCKYLVEHNIPVLLLQNCRYDLMASKASVFREDWTTAEQIENVQLQLLDVVDFINKFYARTKTRLAVLDEKMTSIERKMTYIEIAIRKTSPSTISETGQ